MGFRFKILVPDFWEVVVVEDTADVRAQIKDFLERQTFARRKLRVEEFADFDSAQSRIKTRKIDLLVLDIIDGAPSGSNNKPVATPGLGILEQIQQSVFVPVIIYTAAPEKVKAIESPFVAVIGKEAGGFPAIAAKIKEFFDLRIPQVARAVNTHLERASCSYMWGFVEKHWDKFKILVDKPEFVRILLQRLAHAVSREQIAAVEAEIFGAPAKGMAAAVPKEDFVHPVEMYFMPPIGDDPVLGDIRVRGTGETTEYWVVLWPSCDLVSTGGRKPKAEKVLCAKGGPLKACPEYVAWAKDKTSNSAKKKLGQLLKNNREAEGITKERYHYLPAVVDMPDLVIDFQVLSQIPLAELRGMIHIATLASPFAESMVARFSSYLLRLGTPDLDLAHILERLDT